MGYVPRQLQCLGENGTAAYRSEAKLHEEDHISTAEQEGDIYRYGWCGCLLSGSFCEMPGMGTLSFKCRVHALTHLVRICVKMT